MAYKNAIMVDDGELYLVMKHAAKARAVGQRPRGER
jgi:hypothetical protein